MANALNTINLLPQKGEGLLSQFVTWALNIGRLLIILTETLALTTFIYRFSLDMKIIDLHDQIKAESFIVANFKSSEDTYRDLQTRLALAKEYTTTSDKIPSMFTEITTLGKGKVTFTSLIISGDTLKAEIQAPSPTLLAQFVKSLKTSPFIQTLSIDKVENKTSSATVIVALTAQLKTVSSQSQPTIQPKSNQEGQLE